VKPDKARSTEKIDGMVALIMAIDRAMRHGALGTVSAFEADDYEVRVL
jgi:phage terminase large subunit-like protein